MKIFVWDDVLTDYTSGMMFAVAEDVTEARALLLKECPYIPGNDLMKKPKVYALKDKPSRACWGGG